MKKNLTLVILAAGMGSRFGGLKQIEPIGPSNEFIIDYSVYDAILAGFNKVVFIIKEEHLEIFKNTIGKRINKFIDVEYAFQKQETLPKGFKNPEGRIKPWGTAHAILSAKNYVDGSFAIINSDDFYGRESFNVLAKFLNDTSSDTKEHFCLIGYNVVNTMTPSGSVKRGICETKNEYLTKLIESKIERKDNTIIAEPLNGSQPFKVRPDTQVSMNMLGFSNKIFDFIEDGFQEFLENSNLTTCEYLIPDVVFKSIIDDKADVKVLQTTSKWYGVTYKEDKKEVVDAIAKMIKEGIYPKNLWK